MASKFELNKLIRKEIESSEVPQKIKDLSLELLAIELERWNSWGAESTKSRFKDMYERQISQYSKGETPE